MSWKDCVDDAEAAGDAPPDLARRARELFDEAETEYGPAYGPNAAPDAAARAAMDRLAAETAQKRRQALLTARAQKRLRAQIESHTGADGMRNPWRGAIGLMDNTSVPGAPPGAVQLYGAIRRRLHGRLDELMRQHSRDIAGNTRNRARLMNMVREAFGEDSGDGLAKAMARSWSETAEEARRMFNAAGGHIGKRADWGLPQAHDARAIREAGYEAWRAEILPRLDLERMVDGRTGKAFTPQGIEQALKDSFENIRTEGWASREATSMPAGAQSMANRRADPRFFLFKSADDWIAYQQRFGEADAYNAMMGHIDDMARDIALMGALGPNPAAGRRYAQNVLREIAGRSNDEGARGAAEGAIVQMDNMYGLFAGETNRPVNPKVARVFGEGRQWLSGLLLGRAVLSALTDTNFTRLAAHANGLDFPRILGRALTLLDRENRQAAIRLGLLGEEMARRLGVQHRYIGEVWGSDISQRAADFVFRASGLTQWTQTWRWAFGMELLGRLADVSDRAWKDLPGGLRQAMQRRAIGEGDWEIVRAAPLYEHRGAKFLRPDDFHRIEGLGEAEADRLANLVLGWVDSETNFAVPSVSLEARATLTPQGARPGTVAGEAVRSVLLLKNFPLTVLYTHVQRAATEGTWATRAGYSANLVLGSMLLGGLVLQVKDLASGRDPRPMTDAKFWGAALMQGGGMGIFGDFLFADQNRFGGGLAETAAGPLAGFVDDTLGLTVGNIQQLAAGEETNAGRELADYMRRYTPGVGHAGGLWYTQLAFDRLIWSQVQRWLDPDADDRFRRLARRREREYGQTYWWRPGEAAPDRPPDLSRAVEPAD